MSFEQKSLADFMRIIQLQSFQHVQLVLGPKLLPINDHQRHDSDKEICLAI
jgi:hypothetical protein